MASLDAAGHAADVCRDGPDSPCGGSRCVVCGCCNCCDAAHYCPCPAQPEAACSCASARLLTPEEIMDHAR